MAHQKFNRSMLPNRGPSAIWLLLAVLALGLAYVVWYNSVTHDVQQLSYTQLLDAIESNKVASMLVQDQRAQGKLTDEKLFSAHIVQKKPFWDLVRAHKVEVEVLPVEQQSYFGPFILLILMSMGLLFFFLFRQNQGGGGGGKIFSIGKSRAKLFSANSISVTFKDVAGVEEAKEELRDVVEFLKHPDRFSRLGAKIPRGVLLTGAPGNGKTLLAKAVAGEASCPFFSISGSDFVEVFVGVGASRVRDLFVQAKRNAPCIVFIDEIDAVGRQRGIGLGGGNDEREQTLNQLLAEMDGFGTEAGSVIVLAATNRPDVLDKALMRPGRFDRMIEVPYPDMASREAILRVHVRNVKLDKEVDLSRIARGTVGFSGADLENLINEAALAASKANEVAVGMIHFERARDRIMLGSERKSHTYTQKEREMTSYHESGHTLLRMLLEHTDPLHKVTIVPRGRALGVSFSLPERDKDCHTKSEMTDTIIVCLGGLLAEKIAFNEQTTGVSNDLQKATSLARSMVCRFGMSDAMGPIDYNDVTEHPYLGRDIQGQRGYSEHTGQRIDQEVEKIIRECYQRGLDLLQKNRDKLDTLAKALVERETMQAREVYELLGMQPRETHEFVDKS